MKKPIHHRKKLYNRLSEEIKKIKDIRRLNKTLKKCLIEEVFYNLKDLEK